LLLRARVETGWIAFAAQGGRLRALQVEAAAPRARVLWTFEGDWPDNLEGREKTLQQLRRAQPGRARAVWLLERGQYQLMATEAPPGLPEPEWRDALRWQLKDQVEFDVADAAIDLLRLPAPSPQRQPLLAVLCPRAQLRPVVKQLEAAKFRLHAIDIPDTALRNLCGRCEPEGRAQSLLSFGSGHGQLVITHEGELLSARQIDVPAEALSADDDARRDAAIDRASLELQRTLDSYDRQHSQRPLARVLIVPGPGMAALTEHARGFISLPLQPFDLDAVIDTSAQTALQGVAAAPWLLALGAALREEA
jgi:MSHA biogenesis protein MshI